MFIYNFVLLFFCQKKENKQNNQLITINIMKKLIISALAVLMTAGAMAQEMSKEELKALREQQKLITAALKEATKAAAVDEDAMGQVNIAKQPNFDAARAKVAEAQANPQAATMAGDINRTAGDVEYCVYRYELAAYMADNNRDQKELIGSCGKGFDYYSKAWAAYATPDAKGKTNTKYNDQMAANATTLFQTSSGLLANAYAAYNAESWAEAANYFTLSAEAPNGPMIQHAAKKNPALSLQLDNYKNDTTVCEAYFNGAVCYSNIDRAKAIEQFKMLIGKPYNQNNVYQSIIGQYAQMQDTTMMLEWLQKGMEAMPTDTWYSANLLQVYLDKNDIPGAISAVKSMDQNNATTRVLLARLYLQSNQMEDAEKEFQAALGLDANNLDANLYYGYMYLVQMEQLENEGMKDRSKEAANAKLAAEKMDLAIPYLRKAFQLDVNHENNDIPTLFMQVLYRKFAPRNAANRQALIDEHNEVARAYGRHEYQN